jgi:hypothetical protein
MRNPSGEEAVAKAYAVLWMLIGAMFFTPILLLLTGRAEFQTDYYGWELLYRWALLAIPPTLLLGIGIQMFRMRRSAIAWILTLVAVCAIWLSPGTEEPPISLFFSPRQGLVLVAVVTAVVAALVASIWNLFRLRKIDLLS